MTRATEASNPRDALYAERHQQARQIDVLREAMKPYERGIEAAERRQHEIDRDLARLDGDAPRVEWHEAMLAGDREREHKAWIRVMAGHHLRVPVTGVSPEHLREIEAEAAKLREPCCESCQDAGRIGDAPCHCEAGAPGREPMSETSRAIGEALRPVNLQAVAKRVLGVK